MSLTATASVTTLQKIKELLGLHDARTYHISPDRPNVRLTIKRVSDQGAECMQWLVNMLIEKKEDCKKIIVFCRRLQDCSRVYSFINSKLKHERDGRRLFNMMHSKTPERVKAKVVASLMDATSSLRVVVATKILGLGIDAKCDMVVHYGPPSSTEDYLQQSGRAGRTGEQADAVMFYSGKQLRNLQASMLNAIHNSDNHCIRSMILDDFGFSRQEMIPLHLCCSFCANNCTCGVCDNDEITFLLSSHSPESFAPMSVRIVPPDNLKQLKLNLLTLKEELDGEVVITSPTYTKPDIIHGLSLDIITHIVKEADKLCSIDDLLDFGHIINTVTAAKVLMIFADLFDDLDTDIMGDISDDTDI